VLPGEYRIQLLAPRAFLKSAHEGGEDVTHQSLDLTSGAAGALQIVASTNTGAIQGTAPAGLGVYAAAAEDEPAKGWSMAQVDSNGQFKMDGLTPGKYRVVAGETGGQMPDGGQEITVAEGETATVEVKPEAKP
jgi:hypothetical protein